MTILRRDDWLTTPQGQALAGAEVYYLTQPATTTSYPPSPVAAVYSNSSGTTAANPQITDGNGHAAAYLAEGQLYTVAFYHPLLGDGLLVLEDQALSGGASSGSVTPFSLTSADGGIIGTINGANCTFTLSITPTLLTLVRNVGTLVPGVGYSTATVNGVFTITFAAAPQVGDTLYAFGYV